MLDRWFGHTTHYYLHLLGLSGIAAGLLLSKAVLSISMLFLVLNLLLKADFKTYWVNIRSNVPFLLLAAFILLHILGLMWSADLHYGLKDIWKKMTLLMIPLVLVSVPVNDQRDKNGLLVVFLITAFVTSLINYLNYHEFFGDRDYTDFRDMSLFGSHVRYALLIVMGIAISYSFLLKKSYTYLFIPLIAWFIYYTLYSQVISGLAGLVAMFIALAFYHFYAQRKIILGIVSVVFLIAFGWLAVWLFNPVDLSSFSRQDLDSHTREGTPYTHDFSSISPETNAPIGIYVAEPELEREWNKRSSLDYHGTDKKGHELRQTLIRYMASLDLRKDAEGFAKLGPADIQKIEQGCASVYCRGILARLYGVKYQILNEKDPDGHSLLQRLHYWRAGIGILSENFIIGVGTGDVQQSFDRYYEEIDSPLDEAHRCRAHNNYITVFLTLGIPGIVIFILMHLSFLKQQIKRNQLIPILFMAVLLTSYLMEDTLETQVGATFFAFFFGLYLLPRD